MSYDSAALDFRTYHPTALRLAIALLGGTELVGMFGEDKW